MEKPSAPPPPPAGPQAADVTIQPIKLIDLGTLDVGPFWNIDAEQRPNREHPRPGPSNESPNGINPPASRGEQQNMDVTEANPEGKQMQQNKRPCYHVGQGVATTKNPKVEDEQQQATNAQGEKRHTKIQVYAVKLDGAPYDGNSGDLAGTVLSCEPLHQQRFDPRQPHPPPQPPTTPRPEPTPAPPTPPAPPAGSQGSGISGNVAKLAVLGMFVVNQLLHNNILKRRNQEQPRPGPSNVSLNGNNRTISQEVQRNIDVTASKPEGKLTHCNKRRGDGVVQDVAEKRPKLEDKQQQATDAQREIRSDPIEFCSIRCTEVFCDGHKGVLMRISWKEAPDDSKPTSTTNENLTAPPTAEIPQNQSGLRAPAASDSQPTAQRGSEEGGQPDDSRDPAQWF